MKIKDFTLDEFMSLLEKNYFIKDNYITLGIDLEMREKVKKNNYYFVKLFNDMKILCDKEKIITFYDLLKDFELTCEIGS